MSPRSHTIAIYYKYTMKSKCFCSYNYDNLYCCIQQIDVHSDNKYCCYEFVSRLYRDIQMIIHMLTHTVKANYCKLLTMEKMKFQNNQNAFMSPERRIHKTN